MDRRAYRLYLRTALEYVKREKQRRAEYEEECVEYAKQGFIPRYCPHGMSLWRDYDVICGYCEDGDPGPYRLALDMARPRIEAFLALETACRALREVNRGDHADTVWHMMLDMVKV